MDRRQYLSRVGLGVASGIAGLAGCAAPGEQTETETDLVETETAAETEVTETEATEGAATGTTTGGAAEAPNEVAMVTEGSEYYFDPIGLFVEPGETITWVIESGSHSSTAYTEGNPQSDVRRIPEAADGWDSGILSEPGAEFTHTFDVPGTYDYYCIPHKTLGMVGRLVVGEPGDVDGDPPDGPVPAEEKIVERGAIGIDEFTPQPV